MGKGPVIWAESGGSPVGKVLATGGLVDYLGNPIGGGSSPTTTRGDLIRRGASADERLAVNTEVGQVLGVNSSGDPDWVQMAGFRNVTRIREDFINWNTTWMMLSRFASGGSAADQDATAAVPSTAHPGVWKYTSTGSTNYEGWNSTSSSSGTFCLGGGRCVIEWIAYFSHLSDATDNFTFRCGLGKQQTNAETADQILFKYNHGVNSGKWQILCTSNSSTTTADSGVTVAATTWYALRAVINAAATSVEFFIKTGTGAWVSVGTISTNIPNGYPRWVNPWSLWSRSAGSNSRYYLLDLMDCYFEVTR